MKYASLVLITAANLIPVYGVMRWGWNLHALLTLYWFESFVIGVINTLRILTSNADMGSRVGSSVTFTVVYGFAWALHGIFLVIFIAPLVQGLSDTSNVVSPFPYDSVVQSLWVMGGMYLIILAVDVWRTPRAERLTPDMQWKAPFGRVVVMHVFILCGSFLTPETTTLAGIVILFAGLKIIFEIIFEYSMRKKI